MEVPRDTKENYTHSYYYHINFGLDVLKA